MKNAQVTHAVPFSNRPKKIESLFMDVFVKEGGEIFRPKLTVSIDQFTRTVSGYRIELEKRARG
jgi:hypothetical protein